MKNKYVVLLISALFLTGCTTSNNAAIEKPKENRFSSLAELKQAFIDAGGQCWDWVESAIPKEIPSEAGHGECDSEGVLILYKDGVNSRDQAIAFRSFLVSLKFKVHVLFGDNWMINSDQVEIVYPKMGGTLMTR